MNCLLIEQEVEIRLQGHNHPDHMGCLLECISKTWSKTTGQFSDHQVLGGTLGEEVCPAFQTFHHAGGLHSDAELSH
jgi:hypothetical protein